MAPVRARYVTRDQSSLIAFRLPAEALERLAHDRRPQRLPHLPQSKATASSGVTRLHPPGDGGVRRHEPRQLAGPAPDCGRPGGGADGPQAWRPASSIIDRDLLTIPSLAIHQQRDVNKGHDYNLQRDMQPLWGLEGCPHPNGPAGPGAAVWRRETSSPTTWCSVPGREPVVLGPDGEFFQAPRIDDLACAYATLEGFLHASPLPPRGTGLVPL